MLKPDETTLTKSWLPGCPNVSLVDGFGVGWLKAVGIQPPSNTNVGQTIPSTTHDWEWFIPPIKIGDFSGGWCVYAKFIWVKNNDLTVLSHWKSWLVLEMIPFYGLNSALWNIIICPDIYIYGTYYPILIVNGNSPHLQPNIDWGGSQWAPWSRHGEFSGSLGRSEHRNWWANWGKKDRSLPWKLVHLWMIFLFKVFFFSQRIYTCAILLVYKGVDFPHTYIYI